MRALWRNVFFSIALLHLAALALAYPPLAMATKPLLMSVLAMAISLLAGVWPGAIIAADFIILSAVQAIIFAEAGENAKAESRAAATNILI